MYSASLILKLVDELELTGRAAGCAGACCTSGVGSANDSVIVKIVVLADFDFETRFR